MKSVIHKTRPHNLSTRKGYVQLSTYICSNGRVWNKDLKPGFWVLKRSTVLSCEVLPAPGLWRTGTSARAAGDQPCLLVPSDGVAVAQNSLLDWAGGAERGRGHQKAWLAQRPSLPTDLHHFCCGNQWCLLCTKLTLSGFTPWQCRWSLCSHSLVQLFLPKCLDITNFSSRDTQPGPWLPHYIHGWLDNNKEKHPRARKGAEKCKKNNKRSGVSPICGTQSRPAPILLEKKYWRV